MPRRTLSSVAAAASALSLLLAPVVARAEPAGITVHVVGPGETLSQIADSVGVGMAALARLNNLEDIDFLVAGQSLKLPVGTAAAPAPSASATSAATAAPGAPAAPAAPAALSPRSYVVGDGDTLWSIAQQFSTTTAALVDANNLDDPDRLVLGATLVLSAGAQPDAAAAASAASAGAAGPPAAQSSAAPKPTTSAAAAAPKRTLLVSYTVQVGETLSQIAKQFDVRSDAIAQASALDDPNRLSIGTVLKVPLPGHEHEVKAGETLRDIAAQEKVDLGSLIDFNTLDDPELIRVGQVLMVPTPPNLQSATATNTAAANAGSSGSSKPASAAPAPAAPASAAAASSSSPAVPASATASSPAAPASATASSPAVPAAATAASPAAPASALAAAPQSAPNSAASVAAAAQTAGQAARPAAPVVVVAPPRGAPTDGLAGAGLKLLGAPYVWGGSSPSGFDCSGFIWYAARQAGKPLSRGMLGEFNSGSHPSRDELKPGDLVFFQNTYSAGLSHNGIYIGNNQFVHAADEAAGVTISSLATAYWSSHWFGATRLP